jgi:hypothetical protein
MDKLKKFFTDIKNKSFIENFFDFLYFLLQNAIFILSFIVLLLYFIFSMSPLAIYIREVFSFSSIKNYKNLHPVLNHQNDV